MQDANAAGATPGSPALAPVEGGDKPALTTTGYCAECGTWDAHGMVCSTCGYDFAGTARPVAGA